MHDIIYDNKLKLNQAFKLLRKQGLIARQSFGCCGSCGSYEIATKMEEMHDLGKPVTGYVFFNQQNASAYKSDGWKSPDGILYLSYADSSTNKYPNKITRTGEEIGKMIMIALHEVGLSAEWDGNTDSCVIVKLAEKVVEKVLVASDSETWGE